MFSPVSGPGPLMRNNTNSPTAGEGTSLPPPPYDLNVISQYGAPYGMTSPNGASLSAQNSLMHNNMGRPQSQQSTNVSIDSLTKTQSAPQLYTNLPPAPSHGSGYSYPRLNTSVSEPPLCSCQCSAQFHLHWDTITSQAKGLSYDHRIPHIHFQRCPVLP